MSIWVKICGINSPDAVEAALGAGVQALGFVFAPSPRRVTPAYARELCAAVPPDVKRVAVMLHPQPSEWQEVWDEFRPDVLQTDAGDAAILDVDPTCSLLPVFRDATWQYPESGGWPAWVLFEGARSGQGELPDWNLAASIARRTRVVLAGGLHPGNVAEAIRTVRPSGVDVSSGVESSRGVKDVQRIAEFVAAVRRVESQADYGEAR